MFKPQRSKRGSLAAFANVGAWVKVLCMLHSTGVVSLAQPILTVFPPRTEPQQTVCILGAPCGGTSMVAGIIRKLGIPMGHNIDPANNEDRAFLAHRGSREFFSEASSSAERSKYFRAIRKVIGRRNLRHDRWGWKDPIAVLYLNDVLDVIRNPVFIVVTRDPGVIAQRQTIDHTSSTRSNILAGLYNVLIAYNQAIELVMRHSRPTLLVSYERALRFPSQTGSAIAEFLGLEPSSEFLSWCGTYIEPDRFDGAVVFNGPRRRDDLLSAGSETVRIMLGECLRIRRDGVLAAGMGDAVPAANEAYERALLALNDGNFAAVEDLAMASVASCALDHPNLLDGPLGILGRSIAGFGPNPLYPDVVGAAFFLIGLSHVLRGSAQKAMLYFTAAEIMMHTRLNTADSNSVLSRAIYAAVPFHMGVVAKALQKHELLAEIIRALEGRSDHRFIGNLAELPDFQTFARRLGELR